MKELIKLGVYRHFKGNLYQVIGLAHHSENLAPHVVYKAPYESKDFGKDSLWIRPLPMFLEKVVHEGKEIARFQFLHD